jgi:DNA polymerase family A
MSCTGSAGSRTARARPRRTWAAHSVSPVRDNLTVRVAVSPGPSRSALLCELGPDGGRHGPCVLAPDFPQTARRYERRHGDSLRWVWSSAAEIYPALLSAGVRVARCHDVALTEGLLRAREGREGREREDGQPAESARSRDPGADSQYRQDALFEPAGAAPDARASLDSLIPAHADQLRRIEADEFPERFGALVAAESAGGLAAAEISFAGLPWRADVHDALLADLLGPRPRALQRTARPAKLTELAVEISAALGSRPVNLDSPAQLIRALAAAGIRVTSARSSVLREVDHPVVPLLLQYKELSRLHAAHGWAWLDAWVRDGRFRPEYVVGGVVSGRWASRGGGALQIPRMLRRAVVADPGWVLVVADAAQLEPRVLAALAGDRAFAAAATGGDLYQALAGAFGGDRAKAKVALLSAMYGGAGGEAGQLLAVLRRRFPVASEFVETAARAGEEGRVVRSALGRTCPPPTESWRALTADADGDGERDPGAGPASRARGRFTRNFVVQASAADWALVLIAGLRARLEAIGADSGGDEGRSPAQRGLPAAGTRPGCWDPAGPHLVFFQHDEVLVHCPEDLAQAVVAAVASAADAAGRLVFGATPVRFPMTASVVRCYADAK